MTGFETTLDRYTNALRMVNRLRGYIERKADAGDETASEFLTSFDGEFDQAEPPVGEPVVRPSAKPSKRKGKVRSTSLDEAASALSDQMSRRSRARRTMLS